MMQEYTSIIYNRSDLQATSGLLTYPVDNSIKQFFFMFTEDLLPKKTCSIIEDLSVAFNDSCQNA